MKPLTDAELLLLGLVAEMPRHGYELDQVIQQRSMREWTQIGFSSIYFVLGKLEKMKLVTATRPPTAPPSHGKLRHAKGGEAAAVARRRAKAGPAASKPRSGPKAPKVYSITPAGRRALTERTMAALSEVRPVYSSVLVGMINWTALQREGALPALRARGQAIDAELKRLSEIQLEQQPLPDHVEALFDYSLGQLRAEAEWVARTLAYMETKPWLE